MTTTAEPKAQRPRAPQDHRKKAAAQKALDDTHEILIDGVSYKVTPSDMTGLLEARIRRETGMSFQQIGESLQTAPGVDLVGMFMWVSRIAKGEDVSLEDVLGSVSYASDVEVVNGAEPDSPEA